MKNFTKIVLVLVISFLSFQSYAQNKVLLTDGTSLRPNSIEVEKESVILNIEGERQSISKEKILCVIPEGKTGYTFHQRKNKKLKIKKKDIYYNYEGTDVPRLFAYKYFKTSFDTAQLYRLNPNNTLPEEEFNKVFNQQQKTLNSRLTVSYVAAGVAFLVGLGSFLATMRDVNSLSYNNLDTIAPDILDLELNVSYFDTKLLDFKNCA